MTAEFGGLNQLTGIDLRVLGDWDDPAELVKSILREANLPNQPKVAISEQSTGETVIELQHLIPDAKFTSATQLLRLLRVIKSEAEIDKMREAGRITENAFTDVIKQLRLGMTELEIVQEVNYQLRKHGSLGQSFVTSLYNAGPNHPLVIRSTHGNMASGIESTCVGAI